jgi:tripartite-type tricarboxylate transporter receptor subunit TctC
MMNEKGISVKIVPYQGGGAQFTAVLGGHSDVGGALPAMYLPHKSTGKLIPMLWLDKKRHPLIPDVPTSFEEGVDFVSMMWRGVLAPKGTPRPIIEKLGVVFKKITEDKTFQSMMKRYGDDINYLGPDEFAKVWRAEYEDFKVFAKTLKK